MSGNPFSTGGAAPAFFDSNVWVYAFAGAADPGKHAVALTALAAGPRIVSTQVVNETTNALLRKHGADESRVRTAIRQFYQDCTVLPHDRALQLDASRLRERYGFSAYDGLIVAAALRAGVSILYSEDLHAGLVVRGSLTVVNPFSAGSAPNPAPPGP